MKLLPGATYNFVSTGNDAFCILNVTDLNISKITKEYRDSINQKHIFAVCMVLDLCLLGILIKKKKLSSLLKEFISNRSLILDLAINDFKTRYAGSYLGYSMGVCTASSYYTGILVRIPSWISIRNIKRSSFLFYGLLLA